MSRQLLGVTRRFGIGIAVLTASWGIMTGAGMVFSGTGCAGELGGECVLTGDCKPGFICVYRFCTEECRSSVDCVHDYGPGASCVRAKGDALGSDAPPEAEYNVCQSATTCGIGFGECPHGQICVQNNCKRACDLPNVDCTDGGGEVCFHDVCILQSELPDGGLEAAAENGFPCEIQSDCVSQNCADKRCVPCNKNYDCLGTTTRYCDKCDIPTGQCVEEQPLKDCGDGGSGGGGPSTTSSSAGGANSGTSSSGTGTGSGSSGGIGGSGGGGSSSGSICATTCASDADCESLCPAPPAGINCCDIGTGTCYVVGATVCPLPSGGSSSSGMY